MPLSAGDKLGHYEVLSLLGKGGMGEVYRARDTQLKRDVALKVLPAAFSSDPERLARFQREAELLASLDHPNIGHIYGIVKADHNWALVLALIEGPTLEDRIKQGAIPPDEAIAYSKQIVDAMEYAHEHGVIHRDLKPANIKVTPDGVVKVLDFGLAKALDQHTAVSLDPENSPTLTMGGTQAGVIMGTAAYMSPEQAVGKAADRRADIFSFGVVLFEMLTGKRAFRGESVGDTLAAVVKDTPDWSAMPAGTPKHLRKLLERMMVKDRKQRLQAIGEARIALENPLALDSGSSGLTAGETAPSRFGSLPWIAAAGVSTLALIVAGVGWYRATRPAPPRPLMHLNIDLEDSTPLARVDIVGARTGGNMLALSPDGVRLALTLRGADGKVRLHTRLLNQSQVTPLVGTENAYSPFFSPAGDWIGFFAEGKLKKIAVEGGAAVTLCDALGNGASWGDDGSIILSVNGAGVLSRVPSGGGTPVPVTKLNPGEVTHRWPQVLPGSQALLFTSATQIGAGYDDANIDVVSLKTGERKTIQRGGFSARYLADTTGSNGTGHLIYLHDTALFAVPFDPGRLVSTGAPVPILEDVSSTIVAGGDFAFAQNGTFVYLSGKGSEVRRSISWVESSGKTQPLHAPPGQYYNPRFSPDGKRLAFSMDSGNGWHIWVKDLDSDTPSRLSFLPGLNRFPVWTPDGKNIVFQSTNPAAPGLYGIRSDGSGEAKLLNEGKSEYPSSFSPDGRRLALHQTGNGGGPDIYTMPVDVDPGRGGLGVRLGKAELFQRTPFAETYPVFSPDGRWLAYMSTESGIHEVYVRPFPGPGGRWQVSTGGGDFPVWSRDGGELFFENRDQHVMAVSYTANHTARGDSFAAGKPRLWTETRIGSTGIYSNYDLAPDGKRLAAVIGDTTNGEKPLTHLTFLLNFSDELRRKVPSGK